MSAAHVGYVTKIVSKKLIANVNMIHHIRITEHLSLNHTLAKIIRRKERCH